MELGGWSVAVCVDVEVWVGIQEICCWGKPSHGVNGIESQARVALDALYVVVVNGNEPLDRWWECIS